IVASLTPWRLATSATLSLSASRRIRTICSSLYRVFFICLSLSERPLSQVTLDRKSRDRSVQRVGPQGVLHTALGVVHPLLNLRRREVVGSTGLGDCRLALNDVNDQGALALGRPAFDVFVHLQAHVISSIIT